MAVCFDNLGLTDLVARPEDALRLTGLAIGEGQRVRGYRGDYHRCYLGDGIVVVRTMPDLETGEGQVLGMDVHAVSDCVWECRVVADMTPEGADALSRKVLVQVPGCSDTAVVDVLCADALLSYEPGTVLRLNMVGFPVRIVYSETGGTGVLKAQENSVLLEGVVKDVKVGKTYMGLEPMTQYISTTVSTPMGDLELCHLASAVEEEQKEFVRVGATVSALCVLSGDAAIGKNIAGIVYGEENDLAVLRRAFLEEDASLLQGILHSECVCRFQHQGLETEGVAATIDALQGMMEAVGSSDLLVDYGRITGVEQSGENPPTYIPGKRCLLLGDAAYPGYYALLCLLEMDSVGRIRAITITNDSRYDFEQELDA